MQSALDSAIGLPSRSTSVSWMLVLLMPLEVRRSFMVPPGIITGRRERSRRFANPYAVETGSPPKFHRLRPDPASCLQGSFRNTGPGDGGRFSNPLFAPLFGPLPVGDLESRGPV